MEGDRTLLLPVDWDLAPGQRFQAEVLARFNTSVHHPSSSPHGCFFLLAVFRRFTFRLTEESVSLALHSILGGAPAGFHVQLTSDRHFRFAVASKDVGFHICSLRRVITKHFDVYFHLWRDGGSYWQRELKTWVNEEEKQWTTVSYKKKKKPAKNVCFAKKIVQASPIKKFRPASHPQAIKIGNVHCPITLDEDAQQIHVSPFYGQTMIKATSPEKLKQPLHMDQDILLGKAQESTNVAQLARNMH
ncbi:hypothetical protein BS78_06G237400 [Paspalum vaginatum]|nr:hypothetical protein BS78_06G237400 [Paspalum vaginatum]